MNKTLKGFILCIVFIVYTLGIGGTGLYFGYNEGFTTSVADVINAAQQEIDKHEAVIEILKEQIHELLDRLQERKFDHTDQWGLIVPKPGSNI